MANVKWLAQVHAQEDAYLGKFQARHYRTLRGETIDGEVKWTEAAHHADAAEIVPRARDPRREPATRCSASCCTTERR